MTRPTPWRHRRGLTLTEALVAMFIAAIGMISLMTLFPLGALQMAQANKDARCAELSINAEASMRTYWQTRVFEPATPDPFVGSFGTYASGPSDPVFIDPIGRLSTAVNVAGLTNLPRQTLSITGGFSNAFRYCSLLDDMTYNESGVPVPVPVGPPAPPGLPGSVERAGRYNWTAVLQRSANNIPSVANLTILVFDGRAAGYVGPNSETDYPGWDENTPAPTTPPAVTLPAASPTVVGAPTPRYALVVPNTTSVVLKFPTGQATPPLGKGRWIALYNAGIKLLTFHRVVSVTETTETRNLPGPTPMTVYTCELQTPVAAAHTTLGTTAIVFAGLAEVFERPPLIGQ